MVLVRERFAGTMLSWEWRGVQLEAALARCRYYVRGERHEAVAWAEIRDVGGARRVEVGSFPSVAAARAACERHAAGLCVREQEPVPVDVRISPARASSRKPAKPGRGDDLYNVQDHKAPTGTSIEPVDNIHTHKAPTGRRRPWGTSDACLQRRARREPGDLAGLDAALAAFAHVLGEE